MGGYLIHHGIKGQKWGIRRYQNRDGTLTKEGRSRRTSSYSDDNQWVNYVRRSSSKKAKQIYSDAAKREPAITKDVRSVVSASGATMYGLKHRLKTEESIARKAKSKEVKDAVRYTAILSEKDFVNEYRSIRQKMEDRGYTETKCKNYFMQYRQGKVNHKSVQCNYETPDGYTFEMQFQTKASQRAKDKKVPLYEEARNPKTSTKRKGELVVQMRLLADDVNDPQGIYRIKEHGVS